MGSSPIEVDLDVLLQNPTQLSLVEYDHVVQALPTHCSKETLTDGIQVGRARRDLHGFDARPVPGEL